MIYIASKTHKLARYIVFLLSASLLPIDSFAAYYCEVSVSRILVYATGIVNVVHSGRNDFTIICNMSSEYSGVSVSTCAMWTGMLQAIKKKNGTAIFYYDGSGSCATLPTYGNAPVPYYIGDI